MWYRIPQLILQLRAARLLGGPAGETACRSRVRASYSRIRGDRPYRMGRGGIAERSITACGLISRRYQPFRRLFGPSGDPLGARYGGWGRDARGRGECRARRGPPPEPAQADRRLCRRIDPGLWMRSRDNR